MRGLATLLLLASAANAAPTFRLTSSGGSTLSAHGRYWEGERLLKQMDDLCEAGGSSLYTWTADREVTRHYRRQSQEVHPTRVWHLGLVEPDPFDDGVSRAQADISCHQVNLMYRGWDYAEPAGGTGSTLLVGSAQTYTSIQAAVNASSHGDRIVVDEGFVDGDAATGTVLTLGDQGVDVSGVCTNYTVIEPANYSTNFTQGVRVNTSSDASNMFKIIGGDGGVNPVEITPTRYQVTSWDTTTNVMTADAAHGLSVGDEIVWALSGGGLFDDNVDIIRTAPYYVTSVPTTTTLTISRTLGGTDVDFTTAVNTNTYFVRARRGASCWKLRGAEVTVDITDSATQRLIRSRSWVFREESMNHGLIFEHLWLHGTENQPNGPDHGIQISDGTSLTIRDSVINWIAGDAESKGINVPGVIGPAIVRNNQVTAAGINIFFGAAQNMVIEGATPGENGVVLVYENYTNKEPKWVTFSDASAPSGACYPGSQWEDTTGPTYYTCPGGGTWGSADANGDNFEDYQNKMFLEAKAGRNFWWSGNYGATMQDGDVGQPFLMTFKREQASVNSWADMGPMIIVGSRFKDVPGFANFKGVNNNPQPGRSLKLGGYYVFDILTTNLNAPLLLEDDLSRNDQWASVGMFDWPSVIEHLTVVGSYGTAGEEKFFFRRPDESDPDRTPQLFRYANNITNVGDFVRNGANDDCLAIQGIGPNVEFQNNASVHTHNLDLSGCFAGEDTQETALANVGFRDSTGEDIDDFEVINAGTVGDYRAGFATDGLWGGADTELIADMVGGNDPTVGRGSWTERYNRENSVLATTGATIEFDRPNASNSCDLTLYTDKPRSVEHADTNTAGEKADDRSGNTVSAGHVTFVLGTNTALTADTQYYYEIDCSTDSVKMVGGLKTPVSVN